MAQRETSGITIRLIVEYVRNHYGAKGVERLVEMAGEARPVQVLEDPQEWSSYAQRVALFDAAAEITGDPDVARRIGATVLSSNGSVLLRSLLAPMRSPRAVLRALPMVHSKFDAAGESELVYCDAVSARIRYRIRDGYEPNRHDCRYMEGLLTQVSALFGLPPARVSQLECQLEGSSACVIDTYWEPRRRLFGRRSGEHESAPSGIAELQLDELQRTLADLMETRDLDTALSRVTHRAGAAVAAQYLLLAVQLPEDGKLRVFAEGIAPETARTLGRRLLDGDTDALVEDARHSLTSQVRSTDRNYGFLAAFSSGPFADGEQQMLESYARLAATSLDTLLALEVARERHRIAEVMGAFARRLTEVQDFAQLSKVTVESARSITSSDRALLLGHEEETGALSTLAHEGYPADMQAAIAGLVVEPKDTSEIGSFLGAPERPRIYTRDHDDPYITAMMDFFGLDRVGIVTMRSEQRVFGLLLVGWDAGARPVDVSDEIIARLAAIADQAAGAWEKALLLNQVQLQASLDPLTGLVNRRVFTSMLADLLARPGGSPVAVLFCDLDHFKGVNDALGHAAGDDLLVAVARRLQHCVRSDDLAARLGGDEFTILLTDVDGLLTIDHFAEKVRQAMAEPFALEGTQLIVHLSIGAVVAHPGELSVKEVLRRADAAMYVAKMRGRDQLLVYEDDMLLERSERLDLEASLTAAKDSGQFVVYYQPQVDLTTRCYVGAEALIRWQHPERGVLPPDAFLSVAEETGLIVALDLEVLRTAALQAAAWCQAGLDLRVAVNFSAKTLASRNLVEAVRSVLEDIGLPGDRLEIELTESSVVTDTSALSQTLLRLAELGISIAIDDVGTGYSSLALLHRLPAHRIKIDRSFVNQITDDPASRSVVEAVLLLADRLGRGVIAEGIETDEQAHTLVSLGCFIGQGYLYSKPIPADLFTRLAGESQALAAAGPALE